MHRLVCALLLALAAPAHTEGWPETVSAQVMQRHGAGKSGFLLLEGNQEALQWRLALIDSAKTSLDLQYFIWQADATAGLIFERVLASATRGVEVRILVDDLALATSDRDLAVLSQHPQITIKIWNPTESRSGFVGPLLEYAFNFTELNRRMHNKMLLADKQLAIVGGRNLGNEYFGVSEGYNFRDLDVLVAGAVVPQIGEAFDEYWRSEPAVATSSLAREASLEALPALQAELAELYRADRELLARTPFSLEVEDWSDEFAGLAARMKPGEAAMIQDEPVLHRGEQRRLTDSLDYLLEDLERELIVATPYLIPVDDFLGILGEKADEGANVWVLTGSMGSNNHTAAHSHYRKYRGPILDQGIGLYEFHHEPSPEMRALSDTPPEHAEFVALHIKSFVADRRRIFLGSLNLDPRAVVLNTENGLLIDSPELGAELGELFDEMRRPENAWHVTRDEAGDLSWSSALGTTDLQPARSSGQRVADFFFGLLPIESQL